jgi:hypothetical protein
VFLFEDGRLRGPAAFSTLGMRIQNEQSGSTSLFAQPMAFEPVPEEQGTEIRDQRTENRDQRTEISQSPSEEAVRRGTGFSPHIEASPEGEGALAPAKTSARPHELATAAPKLPRGILESRLEAALAELSAPAAAPSATVRQGHLALVKRWYYRPEARRTGEIFFPDADGRWPIKAILRGVGRVAAKSVSALTVGVGP